MNNQSNGSPSMLQSQASVSQPAVEMTSDSLVVRRLTLCQKCRIGPQRLVLLK